MSGLEERLREEMVRSVAGVRPAPDPLGRLLRRRRARARRWGGSALGAAVVAAALGAQALAGTGGPTPQPAPTTAVDEQPSPDGPLTDWTRRVLDAPVRGAAAAEPGVVDELTAGLLANRAGSRVDPALDRVKVLFVVDVDGRRLYGAAFHNDTRALFVTADGPASASGAALAGLRFGEGPLGPFTLIDSVAMAPPGCVAQPSATTHVGPGGTLEHTWATGGEFLVLPGTVAWWRVTCDGTVREIAYVAPPAGTSAVAPVERGEDLPDVAGELLGRWPNLPGLGVQRYRILWGGTPEGEDRPVVVGLGELAGGSAVVCAVAGTGEPLLIWDVRRKAQHPPRALPAARMATAVAASDAIVTVRLPDEATLGYSDRLLVIAPPTATQLRVTGATVGTVPLTGGVGIVTAPAPATLTIEALDADGRTLATQSVAEPRAERFLAGQGLVNEWG
ncbi:hypothetical protein KZZ52_22800 [Dactylosporangium sp. AC04546]|uniref:hypothetical protein n=1 Tax=Dactylosporangium sp. AC04546 TaxID=2862460 RepID=UPI001EDD7B8F|nr:hypothetical protein [Dactylosporangium sp. AC04546]WVK88108.1 hypothetical protein KZZ52_22800 [Dactylosporangium sp. AC04546]